MLGEQAVAVQGKLAPGQNVSCRERYGTGGNPAAKTRSARARMST